MILMRHVRRLAIPTARFLMSDLLFAKSVVAFCCVYVSAAGIYGLYCYNSLGKLLRPFVYFLFVSAIIEFVSTIMWWYGINNMPLLHFYVAAGFVCIALFYREVFREVLNRKILLVLALLFVLFTIINAAFLQPLNRFSSYTLTAQSVFVIIFSLSTIQFLMNSIVKEVEIPGRKSILWINSGFFIYFASNLLIFYFGDVFTRLFPVYLNQRTWVLHSFFSMIMYTCFIIALWKRPKR